MGLIALPNHLSLAMNVELVVDHLVTTPYLARQSFLQLSRVLLYQLLDLEHLISICIFVDNVVPVHLHYVDPG